MKTNTIACWLLFIFVFVGTSYPSSEASYNAISEQLQGLNRTTRIPQLGNWKTRGYEGKEILFHSRERNTQNEYEGMTEHTHIFRRKGGHSSHGGGPSAVRHGPPKKNQASSILQRSSFILLLVFLLSSSSLFCLSID